MCRFQFFPCLMKQLTPTSSSPGSRLFPTELRTRMWEETKKSISPLNRRLSLLYYYTHSTSTHCAIVTTSDPHFFHSHIFQKPDKTVAAVCARGDPNVFSLKIPPRGNCRGRDSRAGLGIVVPKLPKPNEIKGWGQKRGAVA